MHKALVIVGPTASGKTSLAFTLGKKFAGVLISADSRHVYKGLDIISGKDLPKDAKQNIFSIGHYTFENGTPICLLDIVPPTYSFTVKDFIHIALPITNFISKMDKLPVIVGGTGFYVKALLDGIDTINIPADEVLRERLQSFTVSELQSLLSQEDRKKYEKMNESDRKNKRRLIRAIEITRYTLKNVNISISAKDTNLDAYDFLIVGLTAPREEIRTRIDARVAARIDQGAFEEAEALFKDYENLSEQVKTSNGYKQIFEYFAGKAGREKAIENWKYSEYLNAKKQMTWFKKDQRIHWFDVSEAGFEKKIHEFVSNWYNSTKHLYS